MSNLIFVGKMFTGKTNKIFSIVEESIKTGENLIIFDAKEEYISMFGDSLDNNKYKKYIINLNDCKKSNCYNPLSYPYKLYKSGKKDEAYSLLEKIGKTIFDDKSAIDSFWINSATHLFIGLVMGLFEDASEDQINLSSVWNMLSCFDEKYGASDYVSKYVKTKGENNSIYNTLASIIFSPTDTKGGIISTAREKIQKYLNRNNLLQILSQNEINFDGIFQEKTAFIIIPDVNNPNINNMAVGILEQLIDTLKNKKQITKVVLDNIDMIDLNNFNNMISFGPSKGINYIIATRSKELLFEKYSNYLETSADIIECEEHYDIDEINKDYKNYPTLVSKEINVFDLKKYVSKIDKEQYSDIDIEGLEVKDLLKNINNKLKELD